jgi:hypothetical protein
MARPGRPDRSMPPRAPSARFPLPRDHAERNAKVIEAVRATSTTDEAGKLLGVSGTRVLQILHEIRRDGAMPEDVQQALKHRSGVRRPAAAPGIVSGHSSRNIPAPDSSPASAEPPDPPRPSGPSALPCGSCLHAGVCSIRPQLEAWVRNLKPPAKPHPALTVSVAIDVSCDHYLAVGA